jgi:RNA polymerase sigma-70 factor (ECF subfamily)
MNSPSAVEALLVVHHRELVAFAEKRLGSRPLAEDVVQQAGLRAIESAQGLRDVRAGRAWLFQITRRLVFEHFRGRSEVALACAEAALACEPASGPEHDEFGCACVVANLHRLKPEFAEVLRRVVVEGMPVTALASELGISANAATVRLSRARTALKEQLHRHCGSDSLRDCLDCACGERGCCDP